MVGGGRGGSRAHWDGCNAVVGRDSRPCMSAAGPISGDFVVGGERLTATVAPIGVDAVRMLSDAACGKQAADT